MRMLIVTNRNVISPNLTDETLFGEETNIRGPSELRLAWAEKENGGWRVDLIPEPRNLSNLPANRLPSRRAFIDFREQLINSKKDCVFYIHGYNKPFLESLEQAQEIQERYNVEVVVFSWPANPGGIIGLDYPQAQAIARNSVIALDRIFDRLGRYVREHLDERCDCSFNLLIHSLGNYLFMHFVLAPVFSGETRLFDNIILNAPDVDLDTHAEWVDKLRFSRRVYITINERDSVLDASDIINPDRLGNTARNLTAGRAVYLDFTDGQGVGKNHRHFENTAGANANVEAFFQRALHGNAGIPGQGLSFNVDKNAFELG